jgi:hypothetical protein
MGDVVGYAEVRASGILRRERLTAQKYARSYSVIRTIKFVLQNFTNRVLVVE